MRLSPWPPAISLRGRLHRHVASFPVLKNTQSNWKKNPLLSSWFPLPISYNPGHGTNCSRNRRRIQWMKHQSSYDRIVLYSTSYNMEFHRHITRWFMHTLTAIWSYTESELPAFTPYILSISPTQWPCVAHMQRSSCTHTVAHTCATTYYLYRHTSNIIVHNIIAGTRGETWLTCH